MRQSRSKKGQFTGGIVADAEPDHMFLVVNAQEKVFGVLSDPAIKPAPYPALRQLCGVARVHLVLS